MTPTDSHPQAGQPPLPEDIAIVGMSCLFAGAPDLDTYWQNIVSKVDSISDPPADEWDPKMFYDPNSKSNDRVYCKRGGYIGDLASFRPMDFGVMPIAVDGGEPDQWLALRIAHEALADAGYSESPNEHERTEVILGKGTYVNRGNLTVGYHGMMIDYVLQVLRNLHPEHTEPELQVIKEELKAGLPPFNADTAPALIGNIIAGRIANRLDLMGSSFTVDAACASALLAIEIGVRDLLSHKCDLVLAGGANANTPLPTLSLFCQLGALSRREQIRPFDKNADGTILGSGLGMIVLKRRSDAVRDGNRIYACIKGVGIASDGRALHVMAPRLEGEELALQRAYQMAGFSPTTVGLIEAHGTATPVGDMVEIQALSRVFGERQGPLPDCALGSVKSMIGHTMPAAGIAGVIKAALALHHRVLPPSINCEEPNPALNLDKTPFYINTETRPWIHGADTPRRAGVNSFGFGGINGHVVLEEDASKGPQPHGYSLDWETEVFILEAANRQGLIEQGNQLRDYLGRCGDVALKDISYSLNHRLAGLPSRLAIVAGSRDELKEKLGHALTRLADSGCKQIKDNRGIYFFAEPLKGKLAFLFPGEGAQYPNMLLDLCLHFPEVRNCFDLADRALIGRSRKYLPSEFIFPRSTMLEAERAEVDKALWQLDGAVAGVLIGNWAMWTLLSKLEISPDAIVGHSTGDFAAMYASQMLELNSEADFVDIILALDESHEILTAKVAVPEVTLVAVAADRETVMSVINAVGGDLYLAMDNCPHQNVLLGAKDSVEQVLSILRSRALMYEVLPFDRPYHTPLFQEYAEGAGKEFFSRLPLSAPKLELYSCTTASRYPADLDKIRQLFVDHWATPVLFSKTIEAMYDDGVRLFVEAGPRGNLTAFVSDILRGKPHLAMPANLARRSGVSQLSHLVGVLAAQGVGMNLDYLYARRDPQYVPWDVAASSDIAKPQMLPMKVSLAIPPLKVALRQRKTTARESERELSPALPRNGGARQLPQRQTDTLAAVATQPLPSPIPAPVPVNPAAMAMQEYMKGMEAFISVEEKVMKSFLDRTRVAATGNGGAAPAPSLERYPLLGTVTRLVPGQELTAVRQLNLEEDRFLREHALGGPVSVTDSELRPLVVLPLTMSMELLAEGAAALMPGQVLIGMRDIQAHHWIRVDEAPVDLHISARRSASSPHEVEVELRDAAHTVPAARGVMLFGAGYPNAPSRASSPLVAERKSRLSSAELYGGKLMFHGPAFQGVASVDRSGEDGVVGHLQVLPSGNLFRSTPTPRFVTDPVVLDAAGQLVGFWTAEYLEKGFVVFPYRLDSLRIYGARRPVGERLTCRVTLQLLGNERIRSNIDIIGADGMVWMQFQGWEDRRFDPPKRFHRAWTSPKEALISESWQAPLAGIPDQGGFECYRLEKLFEPGNSLWQDLWASLVLTRQERKVFRENREPEKRRLEWLSSRTAAKDAVRAFLKKHHGLELLPADIEIAQDEYGRVHPQGPWANGLRILPALSLAHANGMDVALVGEGHAGIEVEAVRESIPDAERAFTAEEQRLLLEIPPSNRAEWLLRLWCTKKAAAKARGRGSLHERHTVRISSFNADTGVVRAISQEEAAIEHVLGYTVRQGDYVVATAIIERKTS